MKYTDQQYIQALRESDQKVIRHAYETMKSPFIAFVHRQMPSLQDAYLEDVYQEAFVRLQQNVLSGKLTEENLTAGLQTYFFSIGRLCALEMGRKVGLVLPDEGEQRADDAMSSADDSRQESSGDGMPSGASDPAEDPQEALFAEERLRIIRQVVDEMGAPCAPLLLGYYWEHLTMAQLALRLGYAGEDSAKSQKARCMKKIKAVIGNRLREAGF